MITRLYTVKRASLLRSQCLDGRTELKDMALKCGLPYGGLNLHLNSLFPSENYEMIVFH